MKTQQTHFWVAALSCAVLFACGDDDGGGNNPDVGVVPDAGQDASTTQCTVADIAADPCAGLDMSPPTRPDEGSATIDAVNFVLSKGGLSGDGNTSLATFPLGDGNALAIALDFETEMVSEPVYLIDALGNAQQLDNVVLTMAANVSLTATLNGDVVTATIPQSLFFAGTTDLTVNGETATLDGELGALAYHQISDLIVSNPTVKTLILREVPGSLNDEANVQTGRLVRSNGFSTIVPDGGLIASGGVDLFVSGENRELMGTARVGVHSWSDGENDASDFACNDAAHNMQLCYFGEMLGRENGTNFYFFTIFAAAADDIHLMTADEIDQFSIVTE